MGKSKNPAKPKPPKTKVLRISDRQHNIIMEATQHLQEAQTLLRNVIVGVFAAHDMEVTQILKTDKDNEGHFLVVQVPE